LRKRTQVFTKKKLIVFAVVCAIFAAGNTEFSTLQNTFEKNQSRR
jgi:hypothetical protein